MDRREPTTEPFDDELLLTALDAVFFLESCLFCVERIGLVDGRVLNTRSCSAFSFILRLIQKRL